MLNIQKFANDCSSPTQAIEKLKEKFNIDIREYKDMIVLNYNQIKSPRFHYIADECRGLILSSDFKTVYCRSYDRFYNFGEGANTNFDFTKSFIYSKEDGTLLNLWYHPELKEWKFATRSMGFAEGISPFGISFNDIASEALNGLDVSKAFKFLPEEAQQYTWIFELTSYKNRVVRKYDDTCLYLTGIRNNTTGKYSNISDHIDLFKNYNIKLPKIYSFDSHEEINKSLKELKNLEEGYVCFNTESEVRVKIKSPSYVAIHHLKDNGNINPKRIATLVYENEFEEYLTYFPEDRKHFQPYIDAYQKMIKEIQSYYDIYNDIEEQKKFAQTVGPLPFSGVLFEMRKGKSLIECIDKFGNDKQLYMLELFIDDKWKTVMKENYKNKRG